MITLVKDAASTGTSESTVIISGADTGQTEHSFQIVTNGSPSAVTIQIEGTIEGTNYQCLLQHILTVAELTEGTALIHLINKTIPKIRVKITKLEGGVSPEVSVYYFKGSVST